MKELLFLSTQSFYLHYIYICLCRLEQDSLMYCLKHCTMFCMILNTEKCGTPT